MDAFVLHALDLLAPLGAVRARAMMGGHILYCAEIPVGLVYDERLYLKTDAETKEVFAAAGCEPFTYAMRGRTTEMSYWTAPDAALDDAESMRPWAERALEAALRAREKKARGRARAPFDSWRRKVQLSPGGAPAAMTEIRRLAAPHSGGRNSPPEPPHREGHLKKKSKSRSKSR
ncbi:MAG: TfoX/Sxy family protein [Anaeromyxobacteraceae bacterium]